MPFCSMSRRRSSAKRTTSKVGADERGPDPNQESIDPMVPEHWLLGENVQDAITAAGYQAETVEGIAVDIHDLLQAADKIRDELAPAMLTATGAEFRAALAALSTEFEHIRWHCDSAVEFLADASAALPKA